LDGKRLDGPDDIRYVLSLPAFMIDRVDVLDASPAFGMSGANGAINIITRTGVRREPNEKLYNTTTIPIFGFDSPRIFYSPKYPTPRSSSEQPDTRRTIMWEPNLTLENNSNVNLEYFNADRKATITVTVEGISKEGIPVTGKTIYNVIK
jgi:hypothetical protein